MSQQNLSPTPTWQRSGVFTTDAQLVVRSWDPWLAAVTGRDAGAVTGQTLSELYPELASRGLLRRFERVLQDGVVEVLAPVFHHFLIPCRPLAPSSSFEQMQQYVTIAPLRDEEQIVGTLVTIEDVTERLDQERALARQLESADEQQRLQAARELAAQESRSPEMLVGALGDASWRVRSTAVVGLTQRASGDTLSALIRLLRDQHQNPSVLNSALRILSQTSGDIVEPLAGFLQSDDIDLRIYAALALGEQPDQRAVGPLLRALDDPDTNVRYHAVEALGKLRAGEAVDRLLELTQSDNFFLAFPALEALLRIGDARVAPHMLPLLQDELLREPAVRALGLFGSGAVVRPLVELLNTGGAPVVLLAQALSSIYERYERLFGEGAHIADLACAAIAPEGQLRLISMLPQLTEHELAAATLLLGCLQGEVVARTLVGLLESPVARPLALEALVRRGSAVVPLLIERLASGDLEARQAAALALGQIGDHQAVPALIAALDDEPQLICTAAGALAALANREAFEPLLGLLSHPAPAVRHAAISALNAMGHPDMARRLQPLLRDPNPLLRESAVRIAGYFGYPDCAELTFACCADPDERVRRAAIEVLPFFDDPRAMELLQAALVDELPRVRAAAAHALRFAEQQRAVPLLLGALKDHDPWVRYFAVQSLVALEVREALPELLALLDAGEGGQVRLALVEALGRLGDTESVARLAPLTTYADPDLARAAIEALGALRSPAAIPPLLNILRNGIVERRLVVLEVLGRNPVPGAGVERALQWVAAADRDDEVVDGAIKVLGAQRSAEAASALIELTSDPRRREASIAALVGMGEGALEALAQGLAHPSQGPRLAIVEILARLRRPHASELLLRALEDPAPQVRIAAVEALGQLGSTQAVPALQHLAADDPDGAVRQAAAAIHRQLAEPFDC